MVIKVRAPATEGKANRAVIEILSDLLRIPKSRIEIVSGQTSPLKRIFIPEEYEALASAWIRKQELS